MFLPYRDEQLCDIVQSVTGWNSTVFELMKVGERALAMARVFNYHEGFSPQEDEMHWRFSTPIESSPTQGARASAEDLA